MQRTKTLSFKLVVLLLVTCLIVPFFSDIVIYATSQIVYSNGFESDTAHWYAPWGGSISQTSEKAYSGESSLKYSGRTQSWHSPAINLYNYIRNGGPGQYNISVKILTDKLGDSCQYTRLIIRGNEENSFITQHGTNYYYALTPVATLTENEWCSFSGNFTVTNRDILYSNGLFNLVIDLLEPVSGQNIYFDDVTVTRVIAHRDVLATLPAEMILDIGESSALTANFTSGVTYSSSDNNVAIVDESGVVTGVGPGYATITAYYNEFKSYCDVWVKSLPEGKYFVRNKALQNFMQTDEETGGLPIETWSFDNGIDQEWKFTYVGQGKYSIISFANNLALSVTVDNDLNTVTGLVQTNYEGEVWQHWYVNPLGDRAYKISPVVNNPFSSDWCIAVSESVEDDTSITDNRAVVMQSYSAIPTENGTWEFFLSELPTSGYEKEYNSELWNINPMCYYVNCYGYALNNQVYPETNNLWDKQQPGEFYNNYTSEDNRVELGAYDEHPQYIVDAVKKDFQKYNEIYGTNLIFTEIGRDEVCPAGTYKVALAIMPFQYEETLNSYIRDFHWYRQDSDGNWSHKAGRTIATGFDDSRKIISDPYLADRGKYVIFVGYFAVSAWDNMYTPSESTGYSVNSNSNVDFIDSPPNVDYERIMEITVGMRYEEVKGILGTAGMDVGCGTIVEQYAADNQIVTIGYIVDAHGHFCVDAICIEEG